MIRRIHLHVTAALLAAGSMLSAAPVLDLHPNADILGPGLSLASDTLTGVGPQFGLSKILDNKVTSEDGDRADHGALFFGSDTFMSNPQRMSISGLTNVGNINQIWIYSLPEDALRIPQNVAVFTSTSLTNSLASGSYETSLGTHLLSFTNLAQYVGPVPSVRSKYAVVNIFAPLGTQSILLDFGISGNGARVQELQMFEIIPEPASLSLLGVAALALVRRRR